MKACSGHNIGQKLLEALRLPIDGAYRVQIDCKVNDAVKVTISRYLNGECLDQVYRVLEATVPERCPECPNISNDDPVPDAVFSDQGFMTVR